MCPEKKTVLVIENEVFISTLISAALKREGYKVLNADDHDSFTQIAETSDIDLVISDLMLPRNGGPDIITSLKNNKKFEAIPLIIITGLDPGSIDQTIKTKAILGKPFKMRHLIELVRFQFDPAQIIL